MTEKEPTLEHQGARQDKTKEEGMKEEGREAGGGRQRKNVWRPKGAQPEKER